MGNPDLLSNAAVWPRFKPGDDLSGHDRNPFFVQGSGGRYVDVSGFLGLDEPQVSRGIALADVDGRGALSMAVANQWGPSTFFRNTCPGCGAFLGLHVLVPLHPDLFAGTYERAGHPAADTPGRPAIGAQVTLHLADGRRPTAQVDGGNGHSGKSSPDLHFGLGAAASGDPIAVDVRWRDPGGRIHQQTLTLTAGWHTLVLGWPGTGED
jgi:hypothetical protein